MSETTGSYTGVMIFALVLGVLAIVFPLLRGNIIEILLAVATIVFCLGLLGRQKWALIGVCLTLLVGICIYFLQIWSQPIIHEDTSLILPNVLKMLVGIVLLLYIGRQRIEHSFFA